jgi:uncharacterized membrane protein YphA (DoxX/SURF4 family)
MAGILTLLIIIPFIRKKYHQFLVYYAFILLTAKEVRYWLVDFEIIGDGKEFFEFYSGVQYLLIVGAATLLTGWQRWLSMGLFMTFSLYNYLIYLYWSYIPVTYYDSVGALVLFLHVSFVTYDQELFSKNNILIIILSITVYYTTSRYL